MARVSADVITALRTTAHRLREGAPYQWGHAGACNCGQLAQTVTHRTKAEIFRHVGGEWTEFLNDYCPHTGRGLEDVAAVMLRFGFEPGELSDLEHLRDPGVLRRLPEGRRHLRRNVREDVIAYLEAWAGMLEDSLRQREARLPHVA